MCVCVCVCNLIAHFLGQFQERERTSEIKHACRLKLAYGLLFALDHNNIKNSPKYVGNILQNSFSVQNNFLILPTLSCITGLSWWRGLYNSVKLRHAVQGHPGWTGHSEEFWQNVVHRRRKWQPTPVFLPQEPHEQYEKAKRYDIERWTPQIGRCTICFWGRVDSN